MNNAYLASQGVPLELETATDNPGLKEREAQLTMLIEAIGVIRNSQEWSTLKRLVFDGKVASLQKALLTEARKESPNTLELARLSGELKWAERFADLTKLEAMWRAELTNIRQQLKYGSSKEQRARSTRVEL